MEAAPLGRFLFVSCNRRTTEAKRQQEAEGDSRGGFGNSISNNYGTCGSGSDAVRILGVMRFAAAEEAAMTDTGSWCYKVYPSTCDGRISVKCQLVSGT